MTIQPYGDNFAIVLPDEALHTDDHPFCYNPSCPCHEDPDAVATLNEAVQDGLLTPDEASRIVNGGTV